MRNRANVVMYLSSPRKTPHPTHPEDAMNTTTYTAAKTLKTAGLAYLVANELRLAAFGAWGDYMDRFDEDITGDAFEAADSEAERETGLGEANDHLGECADLVRDAYIEMMALCGEDLSQCRGRLVGKTLDKIVTLALRWDGLVA